MFFGRAEKSLLRHDSSVHVSRLSLIRYPDVRRLLGGQVISQISDAALSVILTSHLLLVNSDGPTTTRLMHMVTAAAIPLLFAGPIAGYLADKISRRHILVGGQILRIILTASLIPVLLNGSSVTGTLLWAAGLCLNRIIYNARIASIRHLVRDHELVAANSLSLMAGSISGVLGASSAVVALNVLGSFSLLPVAIGHLVAMTGWWRIRAVLGGGTDHAEVQFSEVVRQFFQAKTRYALIATSSLRLTFGGTLAATALHLDTFGIRTAFAFGSVLACSGLGSFTGNLSAEWVNEHLHRKPLTVLTFLISSVTTMASGAADYVALHLANIVLTSFLFQNLRLCTDATIQSNARRGTGGRTFAAYDLSYNIAFLAGILGAISMEPALGTRAVITTSAILTLIGATGLLMLRRSDVQTDRLSEHVTTHPSSTNPRMKSVSARTGSHILRTD